MLAFGVAGILLGVLAVFAVVFYAVGARRQSAPSPPRGEAPPAVERAPEPAPDLRPTLTRSSDVASLAPREPEPEPEPGGAEPPPSQWPPAHSFTARCRASGGGCAATCTELAGGRCLDPCFIHTTDCSRDCLKADGTCGWPPPDTE